LLYSHVVRNCTQSLRLSITMDSFLSYWYLVLSPWAID